MVSIVSAFTSAEDKNSETKPKVPAIAKSYDELADLVFKSLDEEDYTTLQELMVPTDFFEALDAPAKDREEYLSYLKRLPQLAKAYREFLVQEKLLPLKGKTVSEFKNQERNARVVKGKKLQMCDGIRIIENSGQTNERRYEIVDAAIGYEGRWYVVRLAIESIEEKLTIPEGNAK
jgi:hypothetical protein